MTSKVQIGRLALQHIGDRYDIASFTEESTEAEQIDLIYEEARDATLRKHPWVFARKFRTAATVSGTVPGNWQYMYTYPSDCLRMVQIVNPLGRDAPKIPYQVARNLSDVKVILTDQDEATLEYTQRITDESQFDAEFVLAFSYMLGSMMAISLTGDKSIKDELEEEAGKWSGSAMSNDAAEEIEPEPRDADWIEARR